MEKHLQKVYKQPLNEKNTPPNSHILKIITPDDSAKGPELREIAGFLMLLGKDAASKIIAHLPEHLIEKIAFEISRITTLKPEERTAILTRFHLAAKEEQKKLHGGYETARALLEKSLNKEQAENILRRIAPAKNIPHLRFLNELEPAQLRQLLIKEPPRLIGIILAHLESTLAADLLKILPAALTPRIIHTMKNPARLSSETMNSIEESLKKKIRLVGTQQNETPDGTRILAEILRNMDTSKGRNILNELGMTDPDIREKIQDYLFTIEQVLHIRDNDLQRILAEMEDNDIALLMKGKSENIRRRFLNNVSRQRAISVSEAYHFMGAVSRKKVDEMTREFIDTLCELEE